MLNRSAAKHHYDSLRDSHLHDLPSKSRAGASVAIAQGDIIEMAWLVDMLSILIREGKQV
jgi:hypothetical protein